MLEKTAPIVMLTDNDVTVDNAEKFFTSASDVPIKNWGFKSIGQPYDVMTRLAAVIRGAGKNLFLESITFTAEEYKFLASFAKEAGISCVLGTIYDKTLHHSLRDSGIAYFPFIGKTPGMPAKIVKSMDEIMRDLDEALSQGVSGVSIPAYMHDKYSGVEILKALREKAPELPVIVAGRVADKTRVDEMFAYHTAFTIGGALFNQKLCSGSYRDNAQALYELTNR